MFETLFKTSWTSKIKWFYVCPSRYAFLLRRCRNINEFHFACKFILINMFARWKCDFDTSIHSIKSWQYFKIIAEQIYSVYHPLDLLKHEERRRTDIFYKDVSCRLKTKMYTRSSRDQKWKGRYSPLFPMCIYIYLYI